MGKLQRIFLVVVDCPRTVTSAIGSIPQKMQAVEKQKCPSLRADALVWEAKSRKMRDFVIPRQRRGPPRNDIKGVFNRCNGFGVRYPNQRSSLLGVQVKVETEASRLVKEPDRHRENGCLIRQTPQVGILASSPGEGLAIQKYKSVAFS